MLSKPRWDGHQDGRHVHQAVSSHDCAEKPEGAVQRGERRAIDWVRDLGNEQRRGVRGKRETWE